jgi:cytochrome c-type biogenesis protein CcmE
MAQTHVVTPDVQVNQGFLAGKAKFLIGGLVIVGAVLILAVRSFQSSAVYYLTLEELQAKGPSVVGQDVRLAGLLDKSSIVRDNTNLVLTFKVTGNNSSLPVVYSFARNPVPDTFELGESVVAEGRLRADGVFEAHQLFVQCPSKYEAKVKETK